MTLKSSLYLLPKFSRVPLISTIVNGTLLNFGKRNEDNLRVIFDQWPKLHISLEALSNQKILNGVYYELCSKRNYGNFRGKKVKLGSCSPQEKHFLNFHDISIFNQLQSKTSSVKTIWFVKRFMKAQKSFFIKKCGEQLNQLESDNCAWPKHYSITKLAIFFLILRYFYKLSN